MSRTSKLFLPAILLLFSIPLLGACDGLTTQTYTVDVSGTDGMEFSGNCSVFNNGTDESHDTAGVVPQQFSMEGTHVSCTVQKRSPRGTLNLVIYRGNQALVAEDQTTDPYGLASAAGS